ncbi:UbiH/UbiF family hydroxylase [Chthonobacter albigriseus]|uniref:UbiH/UbiF family hydroxylase n=1 Tax=Chthonobacter albigriseus TaxID=1683161 RepID=UPI0015EF3C94|nr:UbiH/UbiF family hydroxylase [Chthonobacter albigriseus]
MSETTHDAEIVVVGAGPAGLIAALALADAGASVALVAPPAPPVDYRTTALFSNSVEAMDAFGAWATAAPKAAPLKTMRLVDATRRLIRAPEIAFHASELGLEAFGWNIANHDLTAALGDVVAARSDRILRITEAAASTSISEGRVTVTTVSGRRVTARLAVAADGRGSKVREAAGIPVRTWSYPQTALVLNLDHTAPHYDASTEFHTETGPFTLVPLKERQSSLVCIEKPAVAERLAAMEDDALALELERRARSLLGRFKVASPRQTWPMSSLKAETLGRNRTVLVGETGHAFPPITAQGLNLGVRDVVALAAIVRRARGLNEDLGGVAVVDRYASARRADVTTRTIGVDLLNRSLLTDFLPVQLGRALVLQLARDINPIRRFLMKEGLRPQLFESA